MSFMKKVALEVLGGIRSGKQRASRADVMV